jgi:hypothetical protein
MVPPYVPRDAQIQPFMLSALHGSVLQECQFVRDIGAADKAAIQLVEVQPYQLLVSDT